MVDGNVARGMNPDSVHLVLLHGQHARPESWRPVIEQLPAGMAISAPTLPGWGPAGQRRLIR